MSDALWQIELDAAPDTLALFEAALEPFCVSLSSHELTESLWRLQAVCIEPPGRAAAAVAVAIAAAAAGVAAPEVRIGRLETRDWVREGLLSLPVISVAGFYVRGSHLPPPRTPETIDLLVDAGLAFGTGHHPTTWGCLYAIDRITRQRRFTNALDMGCGSGVLALALAAKEHRPVTAADNDPIAVRTTRDNARINGLSPLIRTLVAGSFDHRGLRGRGPYDLIVANILAKPLCGLAPGLVSSLTADGVVVLSGLLARSEREVLAAYRAQGLRLAWRIARQGWHTLVLRRSSPLRRTGAESP